MRAASEEFASLRLHVPAEDELVLAASANRAGFAIQVSANGPDFSKLFVHRSFLQEVMPMSRAVECDIGVMRNL